MNIKAIERLHELNNLRDSKLITAREYTTLRTELTVSSQSNQGRIIRWVEVVCILSPLLGIIYVLFTKQSGKKKFAILALSLILNVWVKTYDKNKTFEANTSTLIRSEHLVERENDH